MSLRLIMILVNLVLSCVDAQLKLSCGDGDLLPDLKDCTRFLKCHAGVPTSLACPAGLRFNPHISACDWPDGVECRDEREPSALVPGARMIWHREQTTTSLTTDKAVRNILDSAPSLDKPDPINSKHLISSSEKEIRSNSEIKESRKKITNVADVLARVKGKLLPAVLEERESIRLAKHIPAQAVLVESFRPESGLGLRVNVLEGERNKYPRGANIV